MQLTQCQCLEDMEERECEMCTENSIQNSFYSDGSTTVGLSQEICTGSQSSEASVSNSAKLEALNRFLSTCGISPVKECQTAMSNASTRTQKRYIEKTKLCIDKVFSTICPGDEDFLRNAVMNRDSSFEDKAVLETLVEVYDKASTPSQWPLQRQILSTLVKDRDFLEAKKVS